MNVKIEVDLIEARACDAAAEKVLAAIRSNPLKSDLTEDGERVPNQEAVALGALRRRAALLRGEKISFD